MPGTVYVDSVSGNDGTGALENPSLPFQTINAASAAFTAAGLPSSTYPHLFFYLKGTHVAATTGFVFAWTSSFGRKATLKSWDTNNKATVGFQGPTWWSTSRTGAGGSYGESGAGELRFDDLYVETQYTSVSTATPSNANYALFNNSYLDNSNGNGPYTPQHCLFRNSFIGTRYTANAVASGQAFRNKFYGCVLGPAVNHYASYLTLIRCKGYFNASHTLEGGAIMRQCSLYIPASAQLSAGNLDVYSLQAENCVFQGANSSTSKIVTNAAGIAEYISGCYYYNMTTGIVALRSGSSPTLLTGAPFANPTSLDFTPSSELAALVSSEGLTPGAIQASSGGGSGAFAPFGASVIRARLG